MLMSSGVGADTRSNDVNYTRRHALEIRDFTGLLWKNKSQ